MIKDFMEKVKGVVFLFVGLLLLAGAATATVSIARFVRGSVVADGRVARLNAGGSHPEIAFVTRTGVPVSYPQGGLIWGYAVGDKVRVRYDEANPAGSASIDRFGALYAMPLLLAFIGGGLAVLGAVQWLSSRKG